MTLDSKFNFLHARYCFEMYSFKYAIIYCRKSNLISVEQEVRLRAINMNAFNRIEPFIKTPEAILLTNLLFELLINQPELRSVDSSYGKLLDF